MKPFCLEINIENKIGCRLWTILAKSLGISENPNKTPIFALILYFLTFLSATSKILFDQEWFSLWNFQQPLFSMLGSAASILSLSTPGVTYLMAQSLSCSPPSSVDLVSILNTWLIGSLFIPSFWTCYDYIARKWSSLTLLSLSAFFSAHLWQSWIYQASTILINITKTFHFMPK